MRGWRLVVASACLLGACAEDSTALRFQIAFDNDALLARATVIEASIYRGGCEAQDIVYTSRFSPDDAGASPPALGNGTYGFSARAQDARCQWFAAGCTELDLPLDEDGSALVPLGALGSEVPACPSAACVAGRCTGSAGDAGLDAAQPVERIEVTFEAEAGDPLVEPWETFQDDNASGGAYILAPWDPSLSQTEHNALRREDTPSNESDGMATFRFTLPAGGTFRLWARVHMPTVDEDSLWIRLDDQDWVNWNDTGHTLEWAWFDVRPYPSRDRYYIELGPGAHVLRVGYRELGAKVDRLLLTNDLEAMPKGR